MPSNVTAGMLIERARSRSYLFTEEVASDGALLNALSDRQRTLLLIYGGAIDGLVNTTVDIATVINGVLVGSDNGVPVYITTYQDGWPVQQDEGVAVFDFTGPKIAGDPFGVNGGVPGFPLPDDFIRLVKVTCTMKNQIVRPVNVIAETDRLERQRLATPTVFVSGNRLVPVRPLASGNTGDVWATAIASMQLSYVAAPVLTTLADPVTMPAAIGEAMVAALAAYLAGMTPLLPQPDSARLLAEMQRTEQAVADFSTDIVGAATGTSVAYRG